MTHVDSRFYTFPVHASLRNPGQISLVCLTIILAASAQTSSPTSLPTSSPSLTTSQTTKSAASKKVLPLSFESARELLLTGEYQDAAKMYEQLSRVAEQRMPAACGLAQIDLERGDYAAGIKRLNSQSDARTADWHAILAALLAETGDYDRAIEENNAALAMSKDHLRARWQLASLLEQLGRIDEAVVAYRPFESGMLGGKLPDPVEDMTYLGMGFYRYSVLQRHKNIVDRTKHVLTEVYQEAYDLTDKLYWPARLASAELLLENHCLREASDDFELIIKQNPHVAAAHVGLGQIALEYWNFEEAAKHADRALAANPHSCDARVLLAQARMSERRYSEAETESRAALKINPHNIDALSLLAAAQWRQADIAASEETQKQVLAINARPALMHHIMGTWLSAAWQFDEAAAHFKKAIEFAPWWPEPMTALGQLYMEIGDEAQARRILEASFALDSFDHHTNDVLTLLDQLDKFGRKETKHFVIKFDSKEDWVLADYFAETLEKIYDDVTRAFDYRPKQRTMIEVFPDHMGFSIRVTGRPFIATIGASTGPVIAMFAPRGAGGWGRFNWASVLRHEFTHTVTLAATANRIPRWMTEGLAVSQEPIPRGFHSKILLNDTVQKKELFSLDTIDWGFMRPKKATDTALAYAQGEWMMEYIAQRYGPSATPGLLAAFRAGKKQDDAFRDVLKISPAKFTADFSEWAGVESKKWKIPASPKETVEQLEKLAKEKPDDANVHARLAEVYWAEGDHKKAGESTARALELKPEEPTALKIRCHILMYDMLEQDKDEDRLKYLARAEPYIRRLQAAAPESLTALKYSGWSEQAHHHWDRAIELLQAFQAKMPDDPDSYRRLAAIFLENQKIGDALDQLQRLYHLADTDAEVAEQIGQIYQERDDHAKAAIWLRRAIDTDPYDVTTHRLLGESYRKIGKLSLAIREFEVVCKMEPKKPEGFRGLAAVYKAQGDAAKAAEYDRQAAALDGSH